MCLGNACKDSSGKLGLLFPCLCSCIRNGGNQKWYLVEHSVSRTARGWGFLECMAAGKWGFSISVSPQNPHHVYLDCLKFITGVWGQWKYLDTPCTWKPFCLCRSPTMKCSQTCWEYFPGFLSICCTGRSVDVQCYTFCIHVIPLHSSFQSQLLPIIFLNLHSLLLNIFYSVFLFLKKILVFSLLEHCIFPKDIWSCSLNGTAMFFGQDPLFPCVGELFHLNLLVFCFFKFSFILFLTVLYNYTDFMK